MTHSNRGLRILTVIVMIRLSQHAEGWRRRLYIGAAGFFALAALATFGTKAP